MTQEKLAESIVRRVTLISIIYPVQYSRTSVDVDYFEPRKHKVLQAFRERKSKFEVGPRSDERR